MTKSSEMRDLREAYTHFRGLRFPETPVSDALQEWRGELAEMASWYAGVSDSLVNGGTNRPALRDLAPLEQRLTAIESVTEQDRTFIKDGKAHLEALAALKEALERLN